MFVHLSKDSCCVQRQNSTHTASLPLHTCTAFCRYFCLAGAVSLVFFLAQYSPGPLLECQLIVLAYRNKVDYVLLFLLQMHACEGSPYSKLSPVENKYPGYYNFVFRLPKTQNTMTAWV